MTDLRYALIRGSVCLEPLRVLQCRAIPVCGWTVGLFVLGASHAVTLTRGEDALTELLTCLPDAAPGAAPLFRTGIPATGTLSRALQAHPGCLVEVELNRFALDGDELRGEFGADCRLTQAFPTTRLGTPHTRIGWRVTAGGVEVETMHSYPEEGRGVRSRTRFGLREDGS